jgi:hypothetical protein
LISETAKPVWKKFGTHIGLLGTARTFTIELHENRSILNGIKKILNGIGTLRQRKRFRRSPFFATQISETRSRIDMRDTALERSHPQDNGKKNLVRSARILIYKMQKQKEKKKD